MKSYVRGKGAHKKEGKYAAVSGVQLGLDGSERKGSSSCEKLQV